MPTMLVFSLNQNEQGLWTLSEKSGLYGGVFRTREQALRFAKFEAAGRPMLIAPLEQSLAA
jgi:hypothetical protein